jgi:hypothetical protein
VQHQGDSSGSDHDDPAQRAICQSIEPVGTFTLPALPAVTPGMTASATAIVFKSLSARPSAVASAAQPRAPPLPLV